MQREGALPQQGKDIAGQAGLQEQRGSREQSRSHKPATFFGAAVGGAGGGSGRGSGRGERRREWEGGAALLVCTLTAAAGSLAALSSSHPRALSWQRRLSHDGSLPHCGSASASGRSSALVELCCRLVALGCQAWPVPCASRLLLLAS